MDEVTRLRILERLGEAHGERLRGKILQRLLEVSFHEAGFRLVDERLSEGTDFDVMRRTQSSERYSFEVRTTIGFQVPVKPEDLRLMDERAADGYQTGVAGLRLAPGGLWVFIERSWLLPPAVRLAVGTSQPWRALAEEINPAFDRVLGRYGNRAVEEGLDSLAAAVTEAQDP